MRNSNRTTILLTRQSALTVFKAVQLASKDFLRPKSIIEKKVVFVGPDHKGGVGHMAKKEVHMIRLARLIACISLVLALVVAYSTGLNYLAFLRWTQGARGGCTGAVARYTPDGAELLVEIEFEAPSVGYRMDIESLEFTLRGSKVNLGYYRIIIPPGTGSWDEDNASSGRLSLSCPIPAEYWPRLLDSPSAQTEGL